eukprot:6672395-Pyramimonas_sp.AAC.1
MYTRGLFRHPGDVFPFPARDHVEDTGLEITWANDRSSKSLSMSGHIFVDGSCVAHIVKELYRAGRGIVM